MYLYNFLTAMLGVPASGLPFAQTFGFDLNAQVQPVFEGMIPQQNNIPQRQSAIEGISGLAPPFFLNPHGFSPNVVSNQPFIQAISHKIESTGNLPGDIIRQ
jgi:hypothetical protein